MKSNTSVDNDAISDEALKYRITFENYDGTILQDDIMFEYNTLPEYRGETPVKKSTKDGYYYIWNNWTETVKNVDGEHTYIANYIEKAFESVVTFELNNNATMSINNTKISYGDHYDFSVNALSLNYDKDAFNFLGWKIKGTDVMIESIGYWNIDEDVTLVLCLQNAYTKKYGR